MKYNYTWILRRTVIFLLTCSSPQCPCLNNGAISVYSRCNGREKVHCLFNNRPALEPTNRRKMASGPLVSVKSGKRSSCFKKRLKILNYNKERAFVFPTEKTSYTIINLPFGP